jgi:hypothetical protein
MKNTLKKIGSILVIIVIITCCGVSIPSMIKMFKDLNATPIPGEDLTLEAACEFYGKVVDVEGRLEMMNEVTCTTEEPYTCRMELYDPYWMNPVYLMIPVYQGSGDPPANYMAQLPEEFDKNDFYIKTSNNGYARDGSLISVRGVEDHSGSTCTISAIEEIQLLEGLVVDVAPDLTPLTLQEAISEGLVVATINGNGLSQIRLTLKPKVEANYEIVIEPGTMFIAGSEGVQNMVVRQEQIVYLKPNLEVGLDLEVSCANMTLKEPSYSDAFTVSAEPINEDLMRLLKSADFSTIDPTVQQFAIWTITDNPFDSYSYTGITVGGATEYPNEGTIATIRIQFEKAGIDTTHYSIFSN